MTRLEEANYYQQQIEELKRFLDAVIPFDEKTKINPLTIIGITKRVQISILLFGWRIFSPKNLEQTIVIPNYVRNDLIESCKTKLQELESKLESIVGSNN